MWNFIKSSRQFSRKIHGFFNDATRYNFSNDARENAREKINAKLNRLSKREGIIAYLALNAWLSNFDRSNRGESLL